MAISGNFYGLLRQVHPDPEKILKVFPSKYADYFLEKDKRDVSLTYLVGNRLYRHSVMRPNDPTLLIQPYARSIARLAGFMLPFDRLLVLGSGGGVLSNYFRFYDERLIIDSVDIDPKIHQIAKIEIGAKSHPNTHVHTSDARFFTARATEPYNFIIQDTFHGDQIPFHLTTIEFYRLLRSKLTPQGCLAINILNDSLFEASLIKTVQAVFKEAYLLHTATSNRTLLACRNIISLVQIRARSRQRQNQFNFRYQLPDFELFLTKITSSNHAAEILQDEWAPVAYLKQINISE